MQSSSDRSPRYVEICSTVTDLITFLPSSSRNSCTWILPFTLKSLRRQFKQSARQLLEAFTSYLATMNRTIRWETVNNFGAEHLTLQSTASGFLAQSVIIGSQNNVEFGVHYRIVLDQEWKVRLVELKSTDYQEPTILRSDGQGHWQSDKGAALPELDGCIDVDISLTPFTNTLPIRRLQLSHDASEKIKVVYFPFPSFEPRPDEQRYTCLEEGRRYLYEGLERHRRKELLVDEDRIVIDYPGLFQRK